MEEKQLTDEEIVKALECCYNSPCCTNECPYFNKNGRNFCLENKALYKDLKRIVQEHAEYERKLEDGELVSKDWHDEQVGHAEEEIERLTEENEIIKGNPPIIAGRSLGKTIREKLLAFDQMKEKNTELQKQVDELLNRRIEPRIFHCHADALETCPKLEQAVKDTAKEILQELVEKAYLNGCIDLTVNEVKAWFREDYSVEVE